jgi:hypothetical protein
MTTLYDTLENAAEEKYQFEDTIWNMVADQIQELQDSSDFFKGEEPGFLYRILSDSNHPKLDDLYLIFSEKWITEAEAEIGRLLAA